MSEQQWYCPNCGPEISVTVERIHIQGRTIITIVCTGCGETVDEKAETPAFVLALQQRIDEQREKVATWIMSLGLSTGHGDTLEDLLKEAHWQVREYQQRIATLEAASKPIDVRALVKAVADLDFANGDSLCLKLGGDGDNGEILIEWLSDSLRAAGYPVGEEG
jgi:hypothetical protein